MARIAIVGGTGHLGNAIARRLADVGHDVAIGSRDAGSAESAARAIGPHVRHGANADVAAGNDFVIVAVPYAAQGSTLAGISARIGDAIVVDTTVPLKPPKVMRVQLPAAGSAALEARTHLGADARLVSAFHNVAAHRLATGEDVDCDVLVFSDDAAARTAVVDLIAQMGMRGLAGGSLANAAAAEALTSILIYLNKTYGADGAGVRFTRVAAVQPIA